MPSAPSPLTAALLSFILPGLGQVYAGAVRRGLFLALPLLGLVVLLLIAAAAGAGRLLALLLNPAALTALLALLLLFFAYHVTAIVDAHRIAGRLRRQAGKQPEQRAASSAPVAALIALAVVLYGLPGYFGLRALFVGDHVIRPASSVIPSPGFEPEPSLPPAPGTSPSTGRCPRVAAGWADDGRLNLLLMGADEGEGRVSLRTDTIILLSVELHSCRAALLGFPRNMTMVPLPPESRHAYPGGRFPEFIFGLWRAAAEQPELFPAGDSEDDRGWRAVTGAIQELAGVPIDGMVAVNLNGFVQLVDVIGGLWIDVPARLRDASYPREDGSGRVELDIRRGCQLLEGWKALAYARSRHQDDDYQRMRRQQLVLTAARRQLDPLALLPHLNRLLDIAGDNLWLYLDRDGIGELARVAAAVDPDRTQTVTFAPPEYTSPLDDETVRRITRAVREVFDNPDPAPTPRPAGSPAPACPP